MTDDDESGGTAPCFAQELVAGQPVDAETWRDVARFRRAERTRLYAARRALRSDARAGLTAAISRDLEALLAERPGSVALYWPIRGEPDLRPLMRRLAEDGRTVWLPVVVEREAPLVFRRWTPGCAMVRGDWGIPVPAQGAEGRPDVVVAPLVGVDAACHRLGNGGGYYDRTLAAMTPAPFVVGVGFPDCGVETIFPMPWDRAMDAVVTGDGPVRWRASAE